MAIVDINTGKIIGCEEGSKVWYHEKGHIEFHKTDWGVKINYYGQFFSMVAIFFIGLGATINSLPVKLFGFVNALGMVLCYAYEEVWCWAWGLRQYYNRK